MYRTVVTASGFGVEGAAKQITNLIAPVATIDYGIQSAAVVVVIKSSGDAFVCVFHGVVVVCRCRVDCRLPLSSWLPSAWKVVCCANLPFRLQHFYLKPPQTVTRNMYFMQDDDLSDGNSSDFSGQPLWVCYTHRFRYCLLIVYTALCPRQTYTV